MTRTRHKLNEARFFLDKMDEHYFDHVQHMFDEQPLSHPVFGYFLSAFLSAARSVTWVMKHEYKRIPGWEQWYTNETATEQQQDLMKLFTNLRNRTQKEETLPLAHSIWLGDENDSPERDPRIPRLQVTISPVDDESNDAKYHGEITALLWTMDELDGEDLLPSCKQYFELLASLVKACEQRFDVG